MDCSDCIIRETYKYKMCCINMSCQKKSLNCGNINVTIMSISVVIFLKNDASQSKYDY